MNLLGANANTTEAINALCATAAHAAASSETNIIPATPRFGPAVISTCVENAIAGHAVLELLAEYDPATIDGVILAVSHDTARQLMHSPVLRTTETAAHHLSPKSPVACAGKSMLSCRTRETPIKSA